MADVSMLDQIGDSYLSLVIAALTVEHCPEFGELVG